VKESLKTLLDLLDLEQIENDIFRGRSPDDNQQRVFGGQVAGQALVAAGRTVPVNRPVHSLHAYFIRPGDPLVPIVYTVDRVRDGRSFTTLRVLAIQHGKAIFSLSASFQIVEDGPSHHASMPSAPDPETLPSALERLTPILGEHTAAEYLGQRPFDVRHATPMSWEVVKNPELATPESKVWLRVDGELPDDPLLHVCLMTYASDMTLLDTVLVNHGLAWGDQRTMGASLDHAMWFHHPFRADEWLLYYQDTPFAGGARGLARGQIYTRTGDLAVSVMQEGLIRVTNP
jgi:acyl-CoA thioesterase II